MAENRRHHRRRRIETLIRAASRQNTHATPLKQPPPADHPLLRLPNCVITPHIGSRTAESVQRQAVAAVTNLIRAMHGDKPLAQINPEVPVKKVV